MTNFVLLHGAFHGGWCWPRVAGPLRAAGHTVFTPTQTGLGERAHLLSRDITLDVFVQDLVGVLEAEELRDAVLVGHSFGGSAISGAADRVPQRVRQLVYLDSMVLEDGQSPLNRSVPVVAAERRRLGALTGGLSIAPPDPTVFGVLPGSDCEWMRRRLTPHPFGTYDSPLRLSHRVGNGLPCTYVACMDPEYVTLAGHRAFARAQPGWGYREIPTGHNPMITAPGLLVALLEELTA